MGSVAPAPPVRPGACRCRITATSASPYEVHLAHDGHGRGDDYRGHFGCRMVFSSYPSRLVFDSGLLDTPLPQRDPDSSHYFRQQCQMLITRLKHQSYFADDVRMLLLARPGLELFPYLCPFLFAEILEISAFSAWRSLPFALRSLGTKWRFSATSVDPSARSSVATERLEA